MARASSPASPALEEAQPGGVSVHCVEASSAGPELAGRREAASPPQQPAGREDRRWSLEDTDAWWIAGGRGRRQVEHSQARQEDRGVSPTDHIFDALDVNKDGVISRSEFNRAMAEAEEPEDRQEPSGQQRLQVRSVSLDPTRGTRSQSTEPARQAPATSAGAVVLVRPSSGRSGRLSARHREAIVRAGNSALAEPVQDLEPWSTQRPSEPEASHLREVLPPAAARMAEEVLSQEVEGLGECLHICAQRSRTLKLLGFQHLHYDARLQNILKTKARKLGLQLVTELLLLARGLFAFREAARHGFLWERLQGRERCLASTTRDVTGLRKLHHKARIRMRSQLERSLSLAARTLLQYCFVELVRHGMQARLRRLSSSNSAMQEDSVRRRLRVGQALKRWFREEDRRAVSWCLTSWAFSCEASRTRSKLEAQRTGLALRTTATFGDVTLAKCLGAWGQAAQQSREVASNVAAAASRKRIAAVVLEGQFASADRLLLGQHFWAWRGELKRVRALGRRQDQWAAQSMRFWAASDEMLLAMCFLAFAAELREQQVAHQLDLVKASALEGISATRKRYLGAYFRHFIVDEEVLLQSAVVGWYSSTWKSKKERHSQRKIAALISRTFNTSSDVLLSQILNAWEHLVDREKHEWLLQVRQDQMQERLTASRNASKKLAVKQAERMYLSSTRRTINAFFTAWGGLCDNVRTRAKTLSHSLALAQRAFAGDYGVLKVQAFRGWVEVVERQKHQGQLELSNRRAQLSRANSKQAITKHCMRTFAIGERQLLSVYFVHWESVAARAKAKIRGLQTTVALATRAFINTDEMLIHQVFACWARGKDAAKREGQLQRVTEKLKKFRTASKQNAEKRCRRTWLSLEQQTLRVVTHEWRQAVVKAICTRRRKDKDMAHALLVIAATELYTLSNVFHGWYKAMRKQVNRTKTKQHAAVHFHHRISGAERLHLARCFCGWGQVAAVARTERLEASLREAGQRIARGREKMLQAMERQQSHGRGLLLQAALAAWREAQRAGRKKELCTNHVIRNSSAFDMALKETSGVMRSMLVGPGTRWVLRVKALCFSILAGAAAAFKAELQLREANASIQDLRGVLEEKMHDEALMEKEVTLHRQIRLSTVYRHLIRTDHMILNSVFSGWSSAVSQARATWKRKEKGLSSVNKLIKCSEDLLLKVVVDAWLRQTERAKYDVHVQALQKRMDLQGMATGEGIKHRQRCLIIALKWQFDSSANHHLETCLKGWRGLLNGRRRSLRRREELAGRAVRLLAASMGSLMTLTFGIWHGLMLEAHRVKTVEDKAESTRGKLLKGVERALDASAKATLRGELRGWSLVVRANRQQREHKELVSSRIRRSELSANGRLLLLCCESWSHAVLTEKLERMAEANRQLEQANMHSTQMAAKAMEGVIGALSRQFHCSDQQATADAFKEWKAHVVLLKKKAEQRGRVVVRIMGSTEALLAQCFYALVRHVNENQIEQANSAKLMRKEHYVNSLSVLLDKSAGISLAVILSRWHDHISIKKRREETNKLAMMWVTSSGEGIVGKFFKEWERIVMRIRHMQLSTNQHASIMAFEQRQLLLSEQQFSAHALRAWHGWTVSVRHDRRLRSQNAARALRSLMEADRIVLYSCTRSWSFFVQKERRARERRQRLGEQALRRMVEMKSELIFEILSEWFREATSRIRGQLKRANARVEEVQDEAKQVASNIGLKTLRIMDRQQVARKHQDRAAGLRAWRLVLEQLARERRWKERSIVWVNKTAAAVKSSRVAQCFYLWFDEAAGARGERRLAEAHAQLREANQRLDELKASRMKQKHDLGTLSRHFIVSTSSIGSVCLAAWSRETQMTKEAMRSRLNNMARCLRSVDSTRQALLGFAVDIWKNEAGHLRRERLLEASAGRLEALAAAASRAAAERRGRTVEAIERHLAHDKQRLSFWILYTWYGWVLQIKTRRKAKQELGAGCLERIAIASLALQSKFLLIWRCLAVKSILERTLHGTNRCLEDERSAYAAVGEKRRAYMAALLRQPVETRTLQLARCVNGWVRACEAARHLRRRRAWSRLVAERAMARTERALLEQCVVVWAFFGEKVKHERRIEHFMQDMSERASCEVQVANQRVHAAGICVDEARRAQAHTKGRTKERALSVLTHAISRLERAAWIKCFNSWCFTTLEARLHKAADERCKTLRAVVLKRARTAAGYTRRSLDDVILAQTLGIWRLAGCLQVQLRREQKLQKVAFTKACANIVKLRLRLHEQKFLYQWLRICPFKTKEPPTLSCGKGHDFTREPPQFYTRPASAREPRWPAGAAPEHEPEPAPSPATSPVPGQRPLSALEARRRPAWGQEALPGEESWRPWREGKNGEHTASTQSLGLAGKVALANQLGMEQPKEMVQLLEAERACAEGAAAAASATAALALASAAQAGQPRPGSALGDRQQLARQAAASDLEYRRLLEQNRREVRGIRLERDNEQSPPCLTWGVWRP